MLLLDEELVDKATALVREEDEVEVAISVPAAEVVEVPETAPVEVEEVVLRRAKVKDEEEEEVRGLVEDTVVVGNTPSADRNALKHAPTHVTLSIMMSFAAIDGSGMYTERPVLLNGACQVILRRTSVTRFTFDEVLYIAKLRPVATGGIGGSYERWSFS